MEATILFGVFSPLNDQVSYLSVKQLRLRPSSSFYLKADAVEEGDCILLLVHVAELFHPFSGPNCRGRDTHTQNQGMYRLLHQCMINTIYLMSYSRRTNDKFCSFLSQGNFRHLSSQKLTYLYYLSA